MKLTSSQENARTLASILGLDETEATALLQVSVLITVDKKDILSAFLAERLHELMTRTVSSVRDFIDADKEPAIEIVVGRRSPRSNAPKVRVFISNRSITIGTELILTNDPSHVHRAILLLGACYTAAFAMKTLFQGLPGQNMHRLELNYHELLGRDLILLNNAVDLGSTCLAGAGAIGNAFLYALRYFTVQGQMNIVDPKTVRDGNLNRCMFFKPEDIGYYKAERLAKAAQPYFSKLELVPHNTIFRELPGRSDGPWLKRLVVGVDSRRARRTLQSEIPGEVFDASTTDIREVVLHFHRQPTTGACMSCIYYQELAELAHERHVAEVLGVLIEDVKTGFITEESARKICSKYVQFQPHQLVGNAFDTLFKQMCGEGKLKTVEDRQVLAPFSFVSVLAGTYQAIEFIRRVQKGHEGLFNYWRLSPWASPQPRLRVVRPSRPDCEFCGDKLKKQITTTLWET